ncbi:sigma-54 dependent transcriptional regulator [Shewanella algae]|uniref:Sigma-54 dependent transcriptional regulator n=2 Tax=Unclassified Bacteria TaxID=49928 RepID=A0AAU6VWL5_UNCXX|nr:MULTISPECIES: sigma-54 dependent transcriptional regulator [Shewanella]MCT8981411.1 sigma-54 dependent transcriptional regulator [Shewanella algae]MDE0567023.1 sigma-54 dependent transcriptional regulator [Shewanella sp. K8]TVL51086.1 sigma-54-dependent Fis family transcriptional regulator [Shewanella algae]
MDTVLVVDDNQAVCQALSLMLEIAGYRPLSCQSPQEALYFIEQEEVSLVIQDMNFSRDTTSGEEGRELFHALRSRQPQLPIILLTAWTELEMAVELMKAGAADYLAKPWDDNKLLNSVANLISLYKLQQDNQQLQQREQQRQAVFDGADLCGLVFASAAMERCIDLALQLARSDVSVLITGPNGAGKDKLADILHANSPLKHKPLIKVNVGALPMELMEAELFGAEAGAFTGATKARIGRFEAADGGTLFLDEIGNLPLSGQIKLLRVLQTGEFERLGSHQTRKVKVRLLSATNADLRQDIIEGRFREDLFYRLNVVELALPPLAQRKDDILPLVEHFCAGAVAALNKSAALSKSLTLDKSAKEALLAHDWPGNVRELENACKRAVLLSRSESLSCSDFGLAAGTASKTILDSSVGQAPENRGQQAGAEEPGKAEIEAALAEHGGVIARVAKSFGISRQALYRRMEKFGIDGKRQA